MEARPCWRVGMCRRSRSRGLRPLQSRSQSRQRQTPSHPAPTQSRRSRTRSRTTTTMTMTTMMTGSMTMTDAPERIWACMGGPMVGLFVSGGNNGGWPEYVREDRVVALTAERDEAINQLDSAIHSQIVLEKRTAAVMADRKLILEERDRTFALTLERAEKAEAERDRLREALEYILAECTLSDNTMPSVGAIKYAARAALKGEDHE